MKIKTLLVCLCISLSFNASAASLKDRGIIISIPAAWGKPGYREYKSVDKTNEWNYKRDNASLIITRAECKQCRPFTQKDADEINNYKELATTAILIMHKNATALYSVHKNPKKLNFRIFKINANGYQYTLQLGVYEKASHNFSFQMEKEFIEIIQESRFK